jgi:hypothetical protein
MPPKKSYCTHLLTILGLKIDQDFRFSDADFADFTDFFSQIVVPFNLNASNLWCYFKFIVANGF